ncbi:hypothetical protein [Veillonella seminalis]|uniref:Uncharacterized protein n=1 Tax=Veillonella seminalis ACS-216-V-Col6b TaxID=883156 RepID=K9D2Q4_9FIRM|nr:hypothetical protein [Veillonella seminalis]EKU77401.1 hypothetical protein HMPREF9282_02118 [Veillonella seminalis ACS-216-V-Col6b]
MAIKLTKTKDKTIKDEKTPLNSIKEQSTTFIKSAPQNVTAQPSKKTSITASKAVKNILLDTVDWNELEPLIKKNRGLNLNSLFRKAIAAAMNNEIEYTSNYIIGTPEKRRVIYILPEQGEWITKMANETGEKQYILLRNIVMNYVHKYIQK